VNLTVPDRYRVVQCCLYLLVVHVRSSTLPAGPAGPCTPVSPWGPIGPDAPFAPVCPVENGLASGALSFREEAAGLTFRMQRIRLAPLSQRAQKGQDNDRTQAGARREQES